MNMTVTVTTQAAGMKMNRVYRAILASKEYKKKPKELLILNLDWI